MIMSHHSIGLIRPGIAIRPAILHPLPPASDIVQADDQDGHGHHSGHQVHRPVFVPSLRRTWLLARSISGETLAALLLWGSGSHGLPPVLIMQRVLVAKGAAWWAGMHCRSSSARFSSHITTRLHWRLASVRSSIACSYQRVAVRVRHWLYSCQAQV